MRKPRGSPCFGRSTVPDLQAHPEQQQQDCRNARDRPEKTKKDKSSYFRKRK